MDKKLLYYIIVLPIFLFACGTKENKGISAESFFHSTEKSRFRISPNGKFISFLQGFDGFKNIFVLDLSTGVTKRITNSKDSDIQIAFWANDDELIFVMSRGQEDSLKVMGVNRVSQNVRTILDIPPVQFDWVEPIQVINNQILVSLNDRDPSVSDVYRLDILTGKRKLIGANPGSVVKWLTDYQGELRLAVQSDGLTETILIRDHEGEEFRPVINTIYRSRVQPLGFASDNRDRIYALSNRNRDKQALVEIDLNTGKEIRIIYQHPDVDVNSKGYSKQKGRMEYVEYDAAIPGRKVFNPKLEEVFDNVSRQIPNYSLSLIGRDSLFSGFLFHASLDVDPGATYYYNHENNTLLKLADENSLVDTKMLSPMQPITFESRDGAKLTGYLTVPQKIVSKAAIVIPPANVWSRAIWGYNPEVQFLAAQGYVVLQVNTRGIIGFGKENWFAGFKKWGTTIQDDITDATNWLISKGIVDPNRIGIYGVNLGGYSALHSAYYNPNLYACAASYSGIMNFFTYLKEVPPYYKPYRQMYSEMVGDPVADSEYFRRHSPVFHADKIKHPIFIAQGAKDTRSNVNETSQFVKDLRNKGIPVTYLLKSDEGHSFDKEKDIISLYTELASFFSKNLK